MDRKKVTIENPYFLKELETMSLKDLEKHQFQKTKETLERFEYKARRWTDERIQGLERVKYLEK